jgi:hypothetical protein
MNSKHPLLHVTPTTGVENTITYLDLAIHQRNNTFQLGIYHKPTQTDATIHYKSNQHKLAAYRYHINRMLTLPITESAKNQEWNWICTTAKNNGFPLHIIKRIKNNLLSPNPLQITEHTKKTWIPFTYHSPLIYSITNLFRCTPLCIAFRATNTFLANYNITMPHMTAVAYMACNVQPAQRSMLANLNDP